MGEETPHGAAQALTDNTGVSKLSGKKLLKDFVADFLLTAGAALGIESFFFPQDEPAAVAVAFGVASALVKAGYRAALRWATTDD